VTVRDHREHGQTVLQNVMIGHFAEEDGFNRVVEDAHEVITYMNESYPALKFILLGHSMGSFIARRHIQLYGDSVDLVLLSGTGDDSGVARYGGLALAQLAGKKNGFDKPNPLLDSLVFGSFNKGIKDPETKFDW